MNLVKLDDVGMVEFLEDGEFSLDSLKVCGLLDFLLFEEFDGDLVGVGVV